MEPRDAAPCRTNRGLVRCGLIRGLVHDRLKGAPGARIVIESKAQRNYTELGAIEELADARENREAQFGIFVFKRSSTPAGIDAFRRVGDDILAVWDPEDPATDLYLRAGLSIARALVVREHTADAQSEANLRAIERAVKEIEGQVKAVDGILEAARVVEQKGSAIHESAETLACPYCAGTTTGPARNVSRSQKGERSTMRACVAGRTFTSRA